MRLSFKEQILPPLTALLSSSCCVIQLVLNTFSISCAGFAVFTPYRSILTCLTVLLLSYNVYNKGLNNRHRMFSVIVSVGLMLSPDIVQWINQSSTKRIEISSTTHYRVQLSGLGCEACAHRIKSSLNKVEWISDAIVYFNNQTVIFLTENKNELENDMIQKLIKGIDEKYDAQLLDSWVSIHEINKTV